MAVAVVLADSSIVVLALPEIFRQFDTSISGVAWVLISFNLVLALAAVPGATVARRYGPARSAATGLAVFAGGSLVCALATGLNPLIVGRVVQGLGGAVVITAALEVMVADSGSERRAITVWVAAGLIGAAVGPAIGGLLTELVSWQSIFVFQVPVAILAGAPLAGTVIEETREWRIPQVSTGPVSPRPHLAANIALVLASAATAAALFLVVLLLIEAWGMTPIGAALAVTVLPVATLLGMRSEWLPVSLSVKAASGAILLAGGLAGLAFLPGAGPGWVIAPQLLAGFGLALVLSSLTDQALEGRSEVAVHGGWTIASRHLGVVIGLLVLTPIFTHQLQVQKEAGLDAGAAILLDSKLPPGDKIDLGIRLSETLDMTTDRLPDLEPAFSPGPDDPELRRIESGVRDGMEDQLERAATHAFSLAFLAAALFGLAALIPIAFSRRRAT